MVIPATPIFLIMIVTKKAEMREEITNESNAMQCRTHRGEDHTIIGTEVSRTEALIGVGGEQSISTTNTEVHTTHPEHEHPLTTNLC